MLNDILNKDGLSEEILQKLSYPSKLEASLNKNIHYFNENALLKELNDINDWYYSADILRELVVDYRIKSVASAMRKYKNSPPDRRAYRIFNDLLGFRTLCDNYSNILELSGYNNIRVVDLTKGKANDDGYRGVHIYYRQGSCYYPIEIQYNTYSDRQINDWLHDNVYKQNIDINIGCGLRKKYEAGIIKTENDFKEALNDVLSCSTKTWR